jgi:hypothetical protein
MKRSLLLLPFLAACNVGHMIGENQNTQGAITCATQLCNGTTVCVDSQCIEPSGTCGGIAGLQCPTGQRCVDNPRDNCDPNNGGADCGGVCVGTPSQPQDAGHDAGTTQQPDGGPMCYKCVDDPNGCSMAVDCPGICVVDKDTIRSCGGKVVNPYFCETGEVCIDHPYGGSMAVDHPGICIKKVFCGGIAGIACPGATVCVDDPTDNCDPNNGGSDCGGYCTPKSTGMCGGIAGIQCASGLRCLDDPNDTCNPNSGGADCSGLCVP